MKEKIFLGKSQIQSQQEAKSIRRTIGNNRKDIHVFFLSILDISLISSFESGKPWHRNHFLVLKPFTPHLVDFLYQEDLFLHLQTSLFFILLSALLDNYLLIKAFMTLHCLRQSFHQLPSNENHKDQTPIPEHSGFQLCLLLLKDLLQPIKFLS